METVTEQVKPDIPLLLRTYGTFIMVITGVSMIVVVVQFVGHVVSSEEILKYSIIAAMELVISIFYFRLGMGMRAGEKSALYGIIILGTLMLLVAGFSYSNEPVRSKLMIGTFLFLYLLPIISGLWNWKKLH